MLQTSTAVVFESPGNLSLRAVGLPECDAKDCVVEVEWTGVSTGTERLLWDGRMPPFPGLGYPLVPGYESVGRVTAAGPDTHLEIGTRVFVPGSRGFSDVRGLFGGAAERLVVSADRLIALREQDTEESVLLALAATAMHAIQRLKDHGMPELIIGHGVLGRLLARIVCAGGGKAPTVWETNGDRRDGEWPYPVLHPEMDERRDYRVICDASGDASLLDSLIGRLTPGGVLLLAGFYHEPIRFQFAPAFMRELSLLVAAEWQAEDMQAALSMIHAGDLSLAGLITHRFNAQDAGPAYDTAFTDPSCLKLILDWRSL